MFILSSHHEGFGHVLIEEMSQGIPAISTDAPYRPSEVLKNETYGLLTPVGNAEKLKAAIQLLLTDKIGISITLSSRSNDADTSREDKLLSNYTTVIKKALQD